MTFFCKYEYTEKGHSKIRRKGGRKMKIRLEDRELQFRIDFITPPSTVD